MNGKGNEPENGSAPVTDHTWEMMEKPREKRSTNSPDPKPESLIEQLLCRRCAASLDVGTDATACRKCGRSYPHLDTIPVLLEDPEGYLRSCRQQLAALEDEVEQTVQEIQEEVSGGDVLPLTFRRGRLMIKGIQAQFEDVKGILKPALDEAPLAGSSARPSFEVPVTLEYLPYLYRDWGWPAERDGENERALSAVQEVMDGKPLGRTLVVGAGACRLPYDLHRLDPESEIMVLDLDPILFAAARKVTRGESLTMREANLEIGALEQSSKEWVLRAPEGPVDGDRFHFLLGDGLDPPLEEGSLDTVVTPWFIDQGPPDIRDFISTLHRLLKPRGRWLNLGPLRYEPEVPVPLRYSRDELFDLAVRAGFDVNKWTTFSGPYLVSRLNGRGKVEWVLAFSATKIEAVKNADTDAEGPPPWIIFRHLPVPTFARQSSLSPRAPMFELVVSAIDGCRTLDDIAAIVAENARDSGFTMDQIRQAVRQCLAQVHPECGGDG